MNHEYKNHSLINQLNSLQLVQAREALLSEQSGALIDLMFHLNLSLPVPAGLADAVSYAVSLGWVQEPELPALTELGSLVADPIREYRFWLDRERRVHGERDYPLLAPENYRGKSVLEPGSGFGCNLMSLMLRAEGRFVGLEPVAVYRQFTGLLAEREGLQPPEVADGKAEQLPFGDESFDVVLCYSAHQYMDIRRAIREMARVLVPGGQIQIIGATIGTFLEVARDRLVHKPTPRELMRCALTTGNTLCYQTTGRRMYIPTRDFSTSAPVYPSYQAMSRWFRQAGLEPRDDLVKRVGTERCMIADKPG